MLRPRRAYASLVGLYTHAGDEPSPSGNDGGEEATFGNEERLELVLRCLGAGTHSLARYGMYGTGLSRRCWRPRRYATMDGFGAKLQRVMAFMHFFGKMDPNAGMLASKYRCAWVKVVWIKGMVTSK